jgi:adenosylhomocysteine nucleosidase
VKVLVTFALETEFAPWRASREFRAAKWGSADVSVAKIGHAEVGVLMTALGPSRARLESAKVAWGDFDPLNFCVSAGLAGALRPDYHLAQVLAARSVFAKMPPADASAQFLDSSEPLVSFASECGATVVNRFYCTPRVVGRAEEKKYLGAQADAVEMESFGVLQQASDFGIPAVAIRAISDAADENLPLDFNAALTPDGRLSIARVVGQLALRPRALSGVIRLGRQSKQAARSLCEFLDRYILKVAETARPLESKVSAASD